MWCTSYTRLLWIAFYKRLHTQVWISLCLPDTLATTTLLVKKRKPVRLKLNDKQFFLLFFSAAPNLCNSQKCAAQQQKFKFGSFCELTRQYVGRVRWKPIDEKLNSFIHQKEQLSQLILIQLMRARNTSKWAKKCDHGVSWKIKSLISNSDLIWCQLAR